jgi:glycosyltransferase involved in cell wall biosynthesis
MKILINAYACSPHMGSEPGMAWNWILHLSVHCDLVVITEGEFKDKIEQELENLGISNIKFYYLPLSERVRKMCWNQGDWRFYRHYRNWQKMAYCKALEIISEEKIDICHHLNMIGFREPGYLWKIKNIPFVWGPTSVDYEFPLQYVSKNDFKNKFFFWLKNSITKLQFSYSIRVKSAIRASSLILAANSKTKKAFQEVYGIDAVLLNETGASVKENHDIIRHNDTLNLLWVGKFDFRKQLGLALESISELKIQNVILHIVGSGDEGFYKAKAKILGIEDKCIFHGQLPHNEVQEMMRKYDLLFFPSISEGTPHVVLEALANHMPVVCFDICGQGDVVTEETGFKISLTNPLDSKLQFARIIDEINVVPEIIRVKSENCIKSVLDLSWERKAYDLKKKYQGILSHIHTHFNSPSDNQK